MRNHIGLYSSICAATMALCLLNSCDEECEPVTTELDQITDLAGYLDPTGAEGTGVLYHLPGYLPSILTELSATEVDDNVYRMQIQTIDGLMVEEIFSAVETETPYYFADEDDPEELKSSYKIFKDAKCEQVIAPFTETCTKYGNEYYTSEYPVGWNRCKKGTSLCVEIERVLVIHRIHEDSGCTILVRVETTKNTHCDL